MPARTKRSDRLIGRVRGRGPATAPPSREARAGRPIPANAGADRRDLDPSLDTALYNCHCGYVFEAPVSTSIGCPHCGDSQAW